MSEPTYLFGEGFWRCYTICAVQIHNLNLEIVSGQLPEVGRQNSCHCDQIKYVIGKALTTRNKWHISLSVLKRP